MRIQVRGQNIYVEPGRPGNEMDRREMLEFSFSRDWDRYVKFAQFTQHGHTSNVMLMDGRCHVPPEVDPGRCYLNVTGMTADSRDRASTCYVTLKVMGDRPEDMYPGHPRDLYGELREELERLARESAQLHLDPELNSPDMAAQASSAGERIRALEEKAQKAEETLNTLQSGFTSSLEQCRDREQTCRGNLAKSLEEAREQTEQALKDVNARLSEADRARAELNSQVQALEAQVSGAAGNELNRIATQLQETRKNLATHIQAEANAREEMRSDMDSLRKAAETASDSANRVREDLQRQQSGLAHAVDQRMDGFGERLAGLETQTRNLENQDNILRENVEKLRADCREWEKLDSAVENLEKALRELQGGNGNVQTDLQTLARRVEECMRSIDILNQSALAMSVHGHRPPPMHREDGIREQLEHLRESQGRLRDLISGCVRRDQGRQNIGKILGIGEDGSVRAVDPQLAGQVQADWLETDETRASYVRNKPFRMRSGYPSCDGIILYAEDRTPYLLRVNDTGDLTVSAFRE